MSILDSLDNFFYSKPASQAYIMAILVGGGIGYGIYSFVSEDAEKFKDNQISENKKIKKDIDSAKKYLDQITVNGDRRYKIKQLDKKISMSNSQIDSYRRKLNKLSTVMKKDLNSVVYTNHNWSKFLNDITNQAKDNNLKIFKLTNSSPKDTNGSFGKVLELGIKGQGDYGKILAFINDLEKSKLVTTVGKLKLESTDTKPIVDINMSVWGIKL